MNAIMQNSGNLQIAHSPFYPQDMNMPMSAGFEGMGLGLDENSQHYFQSAHFVRPNFGDDMIDARRMSQPDLHLYTDMGPMTPTQQINIGKYCH